MSLGELFPSWSYELYTPMSVDIGGTISCIRTMNHGNSENLHLYNITIGINNTPLWELNPLAQHLRYLNSIFTNPR